MHHMRRLVPALVIAAALGSAVAAPADAAPAKKPKLGTYDCTDGGVVPLAYFDLLKGNKYTANGDTEKSKYVYKAGQKKVVFKSGVWEDYFYGKYDVDAKTIELFNAADDTSFATCVRRA